MEIKSLKKINVSVIDIGLPAKLKEDRSNDIYSFEPIKKLGYQRKISITLLTQK